MQDGLPQVSAGVGRSTRFPRAQLTNYMNYNCYLLFITELSRRAVALGGRGAAASGAAGRREPGLPGRHLAAPPRGRARDREGGGSG